jgi:hypothetical protein
MRFTISALAATGFLLLGTSKAQAATVFNNAADFSATTNPDGVWSYGYLAAGATPVSSTFTPYASRATIAGGVDLWNIAGGGATPPEIFYNSSASVVRFLTITMQPHQAAFHPGPSDQYSDYRFIAPRSGSYSLSVSFTGIDVEGTTTDVHVLNDGASIYAGNIDGYGNTEDFSTTLSLAGGAVVDFAVGYGLNHNYYDDSTGISATLTLNSASVPEPNSVLMLGLSLLGLLALARGRGPRIRA